MKRSAQPTTTVCPKCGEEFECAAIAGHTGCWCATMPHVMPCCGGADAACFCPGCLNDAIAACNEDADKGAIL